MPETWKSGHSRLSGSVARSWMRDEGVVADDEAQGHADHAAQSMQRADLEGLQSRAVRRYPQRW